ncbi:MFS transporter [Sporomusa termitida]|uniref:Enterobactin exporter EntS n=1 Tax=Sporomusa termitida TaxID=2377 RepID=A0A517DPR0_9FIRM|nr:MFS transporter [Sporomusa termitida]QDR79341.1 Enterobactin exporter EntS [Sporomusa termitida]
MKTPINVKFMLRALRYRNYRLFFSGQAVSTIGTWMQTIAMNWLVYRLTESAFMLGSFNFFNSVPGLLLGPVAGVVADRFNRHKVIIITQSLAMLQAVLLAALVITGNIEVWHLLGLGFVLGCINGFDLTARQAFVVDLVEDKDDLPNAIALNSIILSVSKLVGPSIAGILIALVGEGACFLLNAASFIPVLAALLSMRVQEPVKREKENNSPLREMHEGYLYAYHFPPICYTVLLLGVVNLAGTVYVTLMPIFAQDIFAGDSYTLGLLMGATGLGAICGATFMASRPDPQGLERVIPWAVVLLGITLIVFSQTNWLLIGLLMLFFIGLGSIVHIAASSTLMQSLVDEDKRGRVMSLYSMSFGMTPFGNLLAGIMASYIGAAATVSTGGAVCVAGAILFFCRLQDIEKHTKTNNKIDEQNVIVPTSCNRVSGEKI